MKELYFFDETFYWNRSGRRFLVKTRQTDCISTDKIFLLEYDENGKATGRYNLFALPTRTK